MWSIATMRMKTMSKRVFWIVGLPSMLHWWEADMLMMLERWTKHEYTRWRFPPVKVVRLRPLAIERFMSETTEPTDTLVMLDIDHKHPKTVVNDLVATSEYPVHTSLTFKREPKMPVASAMDYKEGFADGEVAHHVAQFMPGEILECDRGGHAAIAVQRQVYQAILELGYGFKEMYKYVGQRDCDQHFAQLTHEAGFKHYVNTAIVSPHGSDVPSWIGLQEWDEYMKRSSRGGLQSEPTQ